MENLSLQGKKVLITGGAGFIGSNLAIKCLELGAKVSIFTNSDQKMKNISEIKDQVEVIRGDITKYEDVEQAIKDKDIIFHLAAQTSHFVSMENPILDIEINLIGTLNVLEAVKKTNKKAKIISVGSVSQLGIAKKLPIQEGMRDDPIEIYSADKLICEKYLYIYHKSHGLYTSFLRLGTIFGERQLLNNSKRGITNFFLGRIINGQPITIYGDGKFVRDYNHVQNVVDALITLAQNDKANGQSFLISGEKMYFHRMVEELAASTEKILGKKASITYIPFPEHEKKVDVGDTEIDDSKIRTLLDFKPQLTFKEGMDRMVLFYKDKFQEYI